MEDQKPEDNLQNDSTPAPADPASAATGSTTSGDDGTTPPADGAATTGDALLKTQQERDEYLAMLKRERADFINFRKRVEEEKRESIMFGQGLLLSKWLPLIENFERALEHLPADLAENDWVKEVVQIKNLFDQELSKTTVERIISVGQPFDSARHEAMMEMPGDKGVVLAEFESGYTFHGKVIKPAKVGVGNGVGQSTVDSQQSTEENGAAVKRGEQSGAEKEEVSESGENNPSPNAP